MSKMIRVDFYLHQHQQSQLIYQLVCRIVDKAYDKNNSIFINMPSQESAEQLDNLLWTYKDTSFLPHGLMGNTVDPVPIILIGYQQQPPPYDVLINMANDIPDYHRQFKRIIQLVGPDPEQKALSRQHYRTYQSQGFDLHTHQLNVSN